MTGHAESDPALARLVRCARPTVFLISIVCALPLYAGQTDATAKTRGLKILAPGTVGSVGKIRYATQVAGGIRRVVFYVDGRRRWVGSSRRRVFRRRGSVRTARLGLGRRRLVRVKRRSGRVVRARRVVYGPKTRRRGRKSEQVPISEPAAEDLQLLDAGFENGLLNWNTAGVGDVVPIVVGDVVRSGARSGKVVLSGSHGRSELILGGDGGASTNGMVRFVEGDQYFYGFSVNVQSMVYGRPGAHNLIMQFKSDGEGSPNFGLQLWDYAGDTGNDGGRGLWSHGEAMGGDRFLAPLDERVWHDIAIHFKASRTNDGFYKLFLDGRLIDSRQSVSMIRPDRTYAYLKNGLYRNGGQIPGTSELRLDAALLGHSLSAVTPG